MDHQVQTTPGGETSSAQSGGRLDPVAGVVGRSGAVIVEEQPPILSDHAVTGSRMDALEGTMVDAGDQPTPENMELGGQQPAGVISLVLQSDAGHISTSQGNTTAGLPNSSMAGVAKGVLDDGDALQSVRLVEGTPSDLVQGRVVTDGQALQLDDGTTAYIQQVSADKFSSLEDGQTVELGDGSTAYILRASLKERSNVQAVQLEDGSTALLETRYNDGTHDGNEGAGGLGTLDPFSGGTGGHSRPATIRVSGTSSLTPTPGLTIQAVAPSTDVFGTQFLCTYAGCGRYYTSAHHLKVHLRTHTGERPFPCSHCSKAFATSYGLKSHTRTHTGEKPYRCPFANCPKSFKTSGDKQKHIRTHTGERPFKCPFEGCDKSFTTSNIRKVHIRTHTGERPYVCQEANCGRAFSSATNFKNHKRIHSGEKPYVCTMSGCGKRFTEYSSLYKHHVVHTCTKPYTCIMCGKSYRQNSTLSLHRRTAHGLIDDGISPTQITTIPGRIIAPELAKPPPHLEFHIRSNPEANTILATTIAPSRNTVTAAAATPPVVSDYVTVLSDPSVQAVTIATPEDVILGGGTTITDAPSTTELAVHSIETVTAAESLSAVS